MKASDYIVEFLIGKGITDVFGYPGGMVTHLMDSLAKADGRISTHVTYHEQGAAFAACGYAQAGGKTGVAFATSGPGATNLITGICNAFFDSIPVLFLTGQVNTFESKKGLPVRQRGFQETDIVAMVSPVTKYAVNVSRAEELPYHLERAYAIANSGRKGPVLLDIPMDVLRADIDITQAKVPQEETERTQGDLSRVTELLQRSKRPVFLLGNGVRSSGCGEAFRDLLEQFGLPVVTTMLAVDIIPDTQLNFGFLGAYGHRAANFILAKSDLVIAVGARLDVRQVGADRSSFAPSAVLVRIDIDEGELGYPVRNDEIAICADLSALPKLLSAFLHEGYQRERYRPWLALCNRLRTVLGGIDDRLPNVLVRMLGEKLHGEAQIVTDVGQNQVWAAQSLPLKRGQTVLFSGGHGAMGYSLPASIGAYYATKRPTVSLNGDGGIQMNLQELMVIARERLPIKIVVFNNRSLGMIRHFQEMYFCGNYAMTTATGGYAVPDFKGIAEAYHIPYYSVEGAEEMQTLSAFEAEGAAFIEIKLPEKTYVFPKLEFGKPNQDQVPLLPRELYNDLMKEDEGENMGDGRPRF